MKTTRSFLALTVVIAAVGTAIGLLVVSRGGAISPTNLVIAGRRVADLYIPAAGLIVGFLFARRAPATAKLTQTSALSQTRDAIAVIIVLSWALFPALVFFLSKSVEQTIALVDVFNPWGESLVMAIIGYYFSKD
jgi:hypothetical protein